MSHRSWEMWIFASYWRCLPAALCCKACESACEWGDWSAPFFLMLGYQKRLRLQVFFLVRGALPVQKHSHNDEDLYPGSNWRLLLRRFFLCKENRAASSTGGTLTCSCFLRCFFGGLEAAASRPTLAFKRAFRRGRRGWDFRDIRKGLAGKGSEYGQPFGLRWILSLHPQGMGVSIEYLKLLPVQFFSIWLSLTD